MATLNKEEIVDQCQLVRDDTTETNWAAFVYDGNSIVHGATGVDYDELNDFAKANDDRVYCFVRMQTGDEMSIRQKFAFITFYGSSISPMAKAKCSTDKQSMKAAVGVTASDFLMEHHIDFTTILSDLRKAGGANYDAQSS